MEGETSWFKIRNRNYSQMKGRREQFERLRERQNLLQPETSSRNFGVRQSDTATKWHAVASST